MRKKQVGTAISAVLKALKNNKFDAVFVKNRQEALQYILDSIPQGSVVGAGDSLTLREIGIFKELKRRNFTVYWPFDEEVAKKEQRDVARKALLADVFLSGSNAIQWMAKSLTLTEPVTGLWA